MGRTLKNKRTKFGAKIFRRYRAITVWVLGHFLKLHQNQNVCISPSLTVVRSSKK